MSITMGNEVQNKKETHIHIFELSGVNGQLAVHGQTATDAWENLFTYLSCNVRKLRLDEDDTVEIEYISSFDNDLPDEENLVVEWK